MRRGTLARLAGLVALIVLLAAPATYADPGAIARDLKDGKQDGTYSAQQIEAFLRDAMTQGYGNPAEIVVVEQQQGQGPTGGVAGERISRPGSPEQAVRSTAPARTLPFTGIDLALVAGGGAFLLLMGLTARRVGRKTL